MLLVKRILSYWLTFLVLSMLMSHFEAGKMNCVLIYLCSFQVSQYKTMPFYLWIGLIQKPVIIIRGVTMDNSFLKWKKSCWTKVFRFVLMIKKKFEDEIFSSKICFLFFVMGDNEDKILEKHLKLKSFLCVFTFETSFLLKIKLIWKI